MIFDESISMNEMPEAIVCRQVRKLYLCLV